jgi:hypothetical protein
MQSSLFDELVSVENLIGSMKQNLDSIQVSSTDRESFLRESSDRIEEQKVSFNNRDASVAPFSHYLTE